jgi:hypothetical protein
MYSEIVTSELQRAGWYPGRMVDMSGRLAMLESEGFTVLPAAARILAEFGRLSIKLGAGAPLLFEPGVVFGDFEVFEYWQCHLKILMTPFAEGSYGETLLVAADDSVLASHQHSIYWIASSLEDALEHSWIGGKRRATELATRTFDV